jgi:predicted RNase H-like nuclease (RuvC/YqgF family)
MTPEPPDNRFDRETEELQAEVNKLAAERDELRLKHEAVERRAARRSDLTAKKERLQEEIRKLKGEPSRPEDPSEPDEPEDGDA